MSGPNQAAKRLQSELMELMMSPIQGVSAFPAGEDLLKWRGTISGAEGSVYTGMEFVIIMEFPSSYPMVPPVVTFETPMFHPNIDMSGNICLDILKDKWSATYSVTTLLLSLQGLLETPNNNSPLNNQAAQLWDKKEEFVRLAKLRYEGKQIC